MKLKHLYISLLAAVAMASCTSGEDVTKGTPAPRHTLIFYMMGQNSINSYMLTNVDQVLQGITHNFPDSSDIFIFFEGISTAPTLSKVHRPSGKGRVATQEVVKEYPMDFSSVTPASVRQVMEDVLGFEETPAQTDGLIVSSHGAGWIPAGYSPQYPLAPAPDGASPGSIIEETGLIKPEGSLTRWIGEEVTGSGRNYLGVVELVEGMAPINFDYVIYDACFMSSIEVLYHMRNSAKYVIASAAEVMAPGFPMHQIVPTLFDYKKPLMERMVKVGAQCYDYYASGASGTSRSATISVVDCAKLEEFATDVRAVYAKGIRHVDPDWIQHLETAQNGHTFHDLEDFLYSACALRSDFGALQHKIRNELLLYANNTDRVYSQYGGWFDARYVSGISVFIPRLPNTTFKLTTQAWYETEWAKAIGATP